jgi:hypothetical protein
LGGVQFSGTSGGGGSKNGVKFEEGGPKVENLQKTSYRVKMMGVFITRSGILITMMRILPTDLKGGWAFLYGGVRHFSDFSLSGQSNPDFDPPLLSIIPLVKLVKKVQILSNFYKKFPGSFF